ncbi:MAG: phage major capsid protein [Planctomycetota bacterium]|jgi:HK97 family phage major capsid protein
MKSNETWAETAAEMQTWTRAEVQNALDKLHSERRNILKRAEQDGRDISQTESDRIMSIDTNLGALSLRVDAMEKSRKRAENKARARSAHGGPRGGLNFCDPQIGTPIGTTTSSPFALTQTFDCADGDPTYGFSSMGDFASSVFRYHHSGFAPDQRLLRAAATGMSQGVASDGGFAVPPTYAREIWDGVERASGNLLKLTDGYLVDAASLTIPANAETSRATGSRYGGVRGYWVGEATQITSSTPKLRQLKLEPHECCALVYATDKLLRNGGNAISDYITRAMVAEINFLVNDAIVNGTGVGQPLGILPAGGTVSVAAETGQAATTIVTENVIKMWARLHPGARANAAWIINGDTLPQLETLSVAVGTGGALLSRTTSQDDVGTRLLGRPLVESEFAATLGTVGDIILADLQWYATGVRSGGLQTAESPHLRFDYNETAFRAIFSVDGQPWLASAVTPFKGSDTVSPFVVLDARS